MENGFQLNVVLAEIHVPRMWVERHTDIQTQACMLTFYPEFESVSDTDPEIVILLDMSNSMKGKPEEDAKKVMNDLDICKVRYGMTLTYFLPRVAAVHCFLG